VSRRRILVLTGKRGGYGAMKPMLRALRGDPRLELQLVVTDQHVDPRFGATVAEIRAEFDVAGELALDQANDTPQARAEALGRCVSGMARLFGELRPDLCVLYGDRGEVLAAALAATTMNVPIAHVQGGDRSGSLDEVMRHAITKLAHLHFPSIPSSAERIARMGEETWRIHTVGDTHLDPIVAGEHAPPEAVAAAFGLDLGKPVLVVLQHSETSAPQDSYAQMVETLEAVRQSGHQAVVVHPCSDAGYEGVLRAIEELAQPPQFRVRINVEAPLFMGLLKLAAALVGNSSSGIIETPVLRLPAINIGRRQDARLSAENVLHVGHDRAAIRAAIERTLGEKFRAVAAACEQPYGDGRAGERIAHVLTTVPLDRRLLVKPITY
jgi:UDP-hydrolysing UDP-N-acetyl-D-glucosamine 2-epimerase